MLVGRLISFEGCDALEKLEDFDEIEFARSEDEDDHNSWTQSRTGRISVYEELAGLDYFSPSRTDKTKSAGCVDDNEDNMPISELIKARSQQPRKQVDAHQGWETSTQTPSVFSVGQAAPARYYAPQWALPNHKPWEGRAVYAPPGYQLKDLLPGGSEIAGPAPRPNPFKDQFDEMLLVLRPK